MLGANVEANTTSSDDPIGGPGVAVPDGRPTPRERTVVHGNMARAKVKANTIRYSAFEERTILGRRREAAARAGGGLATRSSKTKVKAKAISYSGHDSVQLCNLLHCSADSHLTADLPARKCDQARIIA